MWGNVRVSSYKGNILNILKMSMKNVLLISN